MNIVGYIVGGILIAVAVVVIVLNIIAIIKKVKSNKEQLKNDD